MRCFLTQTFAWGKKSLSQIDTVSSALSLIDKDMVRELISKMNNGKAEGLSGVMPEMVKVEVEARVDTISDIVIGIMIKGAIPAECG